MILVHYGEIFTKGQNRSFFQKTLRNNLQLATGCKNIQLQDHRFLVEASQRALEGVGQTFGVVSYALAEITEPRVEAIAQKALEIVYSIPKPLKVRAHRADKSFSLNSTELAQRVAIFLEKNSVPLSVNNYSALLEIEVLKDKALVYTNKMQGLGGLPVGCSGKVVTLLSGGIDSPVAAYFLAKRGVRNVFVHFHPFKTEDVKMRKIEDIVRRLYPYTLAKKTYLVPYAPFTLASLSFPERLILPLFRRFMVKIANRLAVQEKAKALGTGENLSQVASQTLENIAAIEEATTLPVLRPLLTYDKQEIIEWAKKIGTYELSLQPYNDCCQSLVSKHPATDCNAEELKKLEAELPADLIDETIKQSRIVNIVK